MTITRIDNCGLGVNSDLTPEELGNGVWSIAQNMRFNNGYAERYRGTAQVFAAPVVTLTLSRLTAQLRRGFGCMQGLTLSMWMTVQPAPI